MSIYSFENNSFSPIEKTKFNSEGILERRHLQQALKTQIGVIAPECLIISEEFSEWSDSQRRIDLLAVDKNANLVVIELKRTETGEHMELQSLRYAAMVSTLTFKRACEIYQRYLISQTSDLNSESNLLEFLGWSDVPQEDDFALDVRIILVSADFSKELTTSVMWLNEHHLDIRCVRLIPYKHQNKILVDVQQIIPLPEAESYQVKIRQQSEERREARESLKDYTRYQYDGIEYNKRKLVLAVIKKWISINKPNSLSQLVTAFPQEIQRGSLFLPASEAKEISIRQGINRHFLGDDETITFSDGTEYAISNQWGKGNIEKFIEHIRKLGIDIHEIE